MKTRWGSCNVKARRVWLNLELAKKPSHCLDFIILHEMIHLLEKNHSDEFKSYLDEFMPPRRQYKEELNGSTEPRHLVVLNKRRPRTPVDAFISRSHNKGVPIKGIIRPLNDWEYR